jgi:hypothetical protein
VRVVGHAGAGRRVVAGGLVVVVGLVVERGGGLCGFVGLGGAGLDIDGLVVGVPGRPSAAARPVRRGCRPRFRMACRTPRPRRPARPLRASPARRTAVSRPGRGSRRPRLGTARTRPCSPRPATPRPSPGPARTARQPRHAARWPQHLQSGRLRPAAPAPQRRQAPDRSLPRRMTGQDGTGPARPAESKRRAGPQAGRAQGLRTASPSPL